MNGELRKEDILCLFFQLTEIECDACVMTIEEDIERHGQFGQGYLLAVKQCRDILKRIIKDVDAR
jgi:hypothetical protein